MPLHNCHCRYDGGQMDMKIRVACKMAYESLIEQSGIRTCILPPAFHALFPLSLIVRIRLVFYPFHVYYARSVCTGLFLFRVPVWRRFRQGFTGNKSVIEFSL